MTSAYSSTTRPSSASWASSVAYGAHEAAAIDLAAQADGADGFDLMRRAGLAAFARIGEHFPEANTLLVLAGKGNNGGDAWIVAGAALASGWTVQLWQIAGDAEALTGAAGQARRWAAERGVDPQTEPFDGRQIGADPAGPFEPGRALIVDGLLGTGLTAAPRPDFAAAIDAANAAPFACVALDLPSGINGDTGAMPGVAIQAELTVTFICQKLGLLTGRGPDCAGAVIVESLGVQPHRLLPAAGCAVLAQPVTLLPARRAGAFKNDFGHVGVLAGDHGGGGAALLAAEAALRVGAGLVSVGTRAEHANALLARRPELMVRAPAGKLQALELLERASVVLAGPGLGQAAWGQALFAAALEAGLPVVADADALNLLAKRAVHLPPGSVITPHPGEAARLLNCSTGEVEADRVAAVVQLATRYNCVAVLKGAGTLIAVPRAADFAREGAEQDLARAADLIAVCALGNPGMATAGMGDTLAGIVAGLIAQHPADPQTPGRWVSLAVQMHAAAGDRAAKRLGQASMLAADVIDELPAVISTAVAAPPGSPN